MMTTLVRRAVSLAGAGALAAGLAVALPMGSAQAATDPGPAETGAAWLATQPVDGVVSVDSEWGSFADYGLSLDVAFALDAVGNQDETVGEIVAAVEAAVGEGDYIQRDEFDFAEPLNFVQIGYYAGATAKTLTAAVELGADPTDFGGVDLIERLEQRIQPSGRLQDDSSFGDYANVLGQSFAVRGLGGTDSDAIDEVTDFLLRQQCDNGGFRLDFGGTDTDCTDAAAADPDATSNALIALESLDSADQEVVDALADGRDYLLDLQNADGSFNGGTSTDEPNANSTGLAGVALDALGETEAATEAAIWVRAHQITGRTACESGLGADAGVIAYNDTDLAAAAADGIGDLERGIFVRASAQALPLLTLAPAAEGELGITGVKKFVKAGAKAEVTVTGLAPGERACITGGKVAVVATGDGAVNITSKNGTRNRKLTLTTSDATATTTISVLGKAKLKVQAKNKVKKGKKVRVKVKGLAAGEKVKVKRGAKKVAQGKANKKGIFKKKIKVGKKAGKVKIKAVGQFANRKGVKKIRVR